MGELVTPACAGFPEFVYTPSEALQRQVVFVSTGAKQDIYPSILTWDHDRVPNLISRALAGEHVTVPHAINP